MQCRKQCIPTMEQLQRKHYKISSLYYVLGRLCLLVERINTTKPTTSELLMGTKTDRLTNQLPYPCCVCVPWLTSDYVHVHAQHTMFYLHMYMYIPTSCMDGAHRIFFRLHNTLCSSIYMKKGVRRANQANRGHLFQAGWPSSVPFMHSCSVTA